MSTMPTPTPIPILELPDTILGRPVPTDWLWWMKNVGCVLGSPLLWREKHDILLLNVFKKIPQDEAGHLQGVLDFYFCGESAGKDEAPPPERLLDWTRDFPHIWADFRLYAGIDLSAARMHWWAFQALFQSLPSDSWIKTAISWRGTNLNDITDAKERARYARIKQQWALDPVDYEAEYDAAMERRSMNGCSNFG